MLCSLCETLDFEAASVVGSPVKHHSSFKDLEASARRGCQLCQVLYQEGVARRLPENTCIEEDNNSEQICYTTNENSFTKESLGLTELHFSLERDVGKIHSGFGKAGFPLNFGLFATPGSIAAKSGTIGGRPIEQNADSTACYDQINQWMRECIAEHSDSCPAPPQFTPLPTRVVDVSSCHGTDEVKVLETGRRPGAFLALSHCWGTIARFVLDSKNMKDRLEGLKLEELPPSFRDAVTVTRGLGYRYLWIDSLCILQDSKDDWDVESSNMRDYYKNAALTIALDDTPGDHVGFLHFKRYLDQDAVAVPFEGTKARESLHRETSNDHRDEMVYVAHRRGIYFPAHEGDYLPERAWTLQENLLSNRSVHYQSKQLRWECQKHLKVEGLTGVIRNWGHLKRHFLHGNQNLVIGEDHIWYHVLSNYFRRDLTFMEDRFPAISGIVSEVAQRSGFTYKAGIWLEDLHRSLLWYVNGRSNKVDCFVSPSWSWASIKAIYPLSYHAMSRLDRPGGPRAAEFVDCIVSLDGKDPFGRLTSGSITLRGLWLSLSDWGPKHPIIIGQTFSGEWQRGLECNLDMPIDHPDCIPEDDFGPGNGIGPDRRLGVAAGASILQGLCLLHIAIFPPPYYDSRAWACYQLILTPTTTPGEFQRVGIAYTALEQFTAAGDWEWKEVRIV